MKIWFRLHGFEPCSWTSVYDYLRVAFQDIGVGVYDSEPPRETEDCVELWWGDPQFWRWSDKPFKARVALALSEARSILSKGRANVISNLNKSDLIICPAESATRAFREAPIDTPIKVAHFGVDSDEFAFVERDWSGCLTFLHAGVTQFRKGSWLVPEAFIQAFKPTDNVRLLIVAPRTSPMFTQLSCEYGNQLQIEFQNGRVETMMDAYRESHIYVSPHLSEGFGLMPLEAMSTGMPCLMARCSAPSEYFDDRYGFWIEMSEDYAPIAQCLPDTNGFWRLPDIKSLVSVMRRAYMNRHECANKGSEASYYAHTNMSWVTTARKVVAHIKEMLDEKNIGSDVGLQRGEAVTGPSGKYIPACR